MARNSRSYERSLSYRERHRDFGAALTMIDIDCLEFDQSGEPVAIVEVKRANEQAPHWQQHVLQRHADKAHLPLFLVRHAEDFSWYDAEAVNQRARDYLAVDETQRQMTEREWITLLYRVRHRSPPANLFDGDNLRYTSHSDDYTNYLMKSKYGDQGNQPPQSEATDYTMDDTIHTAQAKIIEINGFFLLLEWNSFHGIIPVGQRTLYERLTLLSSRIRVVIIVGDAETMTVQEIVVVANGRCGMAEATDGKALNRRIQQWASRAKAYTGKEMS